MPVLDRRRFLATCSGFGLGTTLFPGALWMLARDQGTVTKDMIEQAAIIADVPIAPEYRDVMVASLNQAVKGYDAIYALHMTNSVAPALDFNPTLPSMTFPTARRPMRLSSTADRDVPRNIEDLCFATVRELAALVRARKVSSTALTEMYLARLKRLDPVLHCVITLTEDRAMAQAREADRDIAAGKYRGPLHGLPWGAKDLLAVKGYRTTWGAGGFEQQMIDEDATVVTRLDHAGAVLIAKLTLGALALGDRWYGGVTRNPWRPAQGSSGSSAGPASATAAGCVAFSIGSETLGSISSPSTRCGCTGLRPTFGRVPRTGAMALSWSMDKLGPLCRSAEDCAIVLDAIYGPDGHDRTVHAAAFNWDAQVDPRTLRVGYLKHDFENDPPQLRLFAPPPAASDTTAQRQRDVQHAHVAYDRQFDTAALAKLTAMGFAMTPVQLPDMPWQAMTSLLSVEAAAAFDELTRSGRDKLLTEQSPNDWPNTFRTARLTPAVEYVQANRARMLAIEAMATVFEPFDVIVAPTNSTQLVITNLTGYPSVIVPNGVRGDDAPPYDPPSGPGPFGGSWGGPGTPVSLTFLGALYGEAKLLAFARAYQDATGFHRQHPMAL
jgi:Asp-tRNA(Asn)/Glu-tRNA(Gln) amidotransferase A subunit family amidase